MEEMDLKDSLTKSGGDKKKAAKAFRILFLSCRGQAEDLLHTRIDDTTDGHAAWEALCAYYEAATVSRIASLHEQFFTIAPPPNPSGIHSYISQVLEIKQQLSQLDHKETPSDASVYGKIIVGLTGELLAYSDTLDDTVNKLDEKIQFLQQKARTISTSRPEHAQAFTAQAGPDTNTKHKQKHNRDKRSDRTPARDKGNNEQGNMSKLKKQPPRKQFKCPYHMTNSHSQSDCRAIKEMMAANAAQAHAPAQDYTDLFAKSSTTDEIPELENPSLADY
jgi:hypothetical protein